MHGIVHKFSCPHTHQQNRRVERKHRHIVDIDMTILTRASIPLIYWDDAFLSSVYLINRLSSPNIFNVSPFELLHNQAPNYSFLKNFNCACYPFLRLTMIQNSLTNHN